MNLIFHSRHVQIIVFVHLISVFFSMYPETIDNTNVTHDNSTGQSHGISG